MSKNFELLTQIETEIGGAMAERSPDLERTKRNESLAVSDAPGGEEEVKKLVQKVFFCNSGAPCRRVVFCGIEAGNGSSSVVARTARHLAAKARERVCLIDANPVHGGASALYAVPPGLEDERSGSILECCVPIAPKLSLLRWPVAGGRRELPRSGELSSLFAQLQQEFGYILVDAPGCLCGEDATLWAQAAEAAILVVGAESSHRAAAGKAKQKLEEAGARFAGAVLHNRSFPIPKALYDRL